MTTTAEQLAEALRPFAAITQPTFQDTITTTVRAEDIQRARAVLQRFEDREELRQHRVLVAGSREHSDRNLIFAALDAEAEEHGDLIVVHGAAPGADTLAGVWARQNERPELRFPAEWTRYGKPAGPRRNRVMLREAEPDSGLLFPLPNSKGTWDMKDIAEAAGVPIEVFGGECG
jgi:hypothetical protein